MYADKYLHRRRRCSLTFGSHAFGLVIGPINRAVFATPSFSPRLKVYLLSTLGIVAVYIAVHCTLSVCQMDSPDLVTAITPSFLNALPLGLSPTKTPRISDGIFVLAALSVNFGLGLGMIWIESTQWLARLPCGGGAGACIEYSSLVWEWRQIHAVDEGTPHPHFPRTV
jgi:hypothetical protein